MGGALIAVTLPFDGLGPWVQAFYLSALALVLVLMVWTTILFVSSRRALRSAPAPGDAADFLWVFLVPALNEEVTIVDSVRRLLAVECPNRVVLVVDDGSDDDTPELLAGIPDPELVVLRRDPPEARKGKAAALNDAWRSLDGLLSAGRWAGWPRDRVVVVVVDADGRLDPRTPRFVSGHLADPLVGGVQLLVRIYNRSRVLTWFQDVEFSIFGLLFQAGRTPIGTAGMGGNGQCNRLVALDDVVEPDDEGPWRDRLTEDQDLGLRLIAAGWKGVQETRATVEQQGPTSLLPLIRQRTRWAQGNLQVMSQIGTIARLSRPAAVRVDLVGSLLLPFFQALLALDFVLTFVFIAFDLGDFRFTDVSELVVLYVLGFGALILGCVAWGLHRGRWGILRGLLVVHVFVLYSFLSWPVLARAAARQLARRRDWAKTAREPLSEQ